MQLTTKFGEIVGSRTGLVPGHPLSTGQPRRSTTSSTERRQKTLGPRLVLTWLLEGSRRDRRGAAIDERVYFPSVLRELLLDLGVRVLRGGNHPAQLC